MDQGGDQACSKQHFTGVGYPLLSLVIKYDTTVIINLPDISTGLPSGAKMRRGNKPHTAPED
jgi:hypothetical protein